MPVLAATEAGIARRIPPGFDERFSTNDQGWPDRVGSTAWFGNGGYSLAPRQVGQFVALREPRGDVYRDVRVTGVFRKLEGPPGGGYGLILRDQSSPPPDGLTQLGRYYVCEIGDRGEIGIWRREDDRWIELLPWTPSEAVHRGDAVNELVVEAMGARLSVVVNGTPVAELEDTSSPEGAVGLFAGGDGNQVLVQRFAVEPLT